MMQKIDQVSHQANSSIQASPYQKNIRLEFFNISYYVTSSAKYKLQSCKLWHEQRKILNDISGVVEPGDLVALMGSSGAGKSTLLNILSRRIRSNKGKILLNGVEADINPVLKASSCYVQQEDLFFAYNTVLEHLEQQAALRLELPIEERKKRIDSIMQRFSLTKIRDSMIGDIAQGTRRGISGGEKKRLSLATELLINPKLIFADEPTSGLDAFMAYSVTEVLKSLTDMNHTVVTTIHQPSSDVFSLFNKLLLLAEGKLIFYGPRLAAIAYFLKLGYPCPPYTNSADHFIELVSIDWENPTSKLTEIDRWAQTWKQYSKSFLYEWETELKDKFTATLANETCTSESPQHMLSGSYVASNDEELIAAAYDKDGNIRKPSWITVASTLLRRTFNSSARNPSVMRARLIQTVFTAFLSGLVYFRLSQASNHSKSGACFFILVNLGFMMTFGAITTFMTDKTIVLRERDAGLYSLATYFWMKIISDFVFQFYLPIVYACVSWYMMGINDEFWRFLTATGFILLMSLSVCSIGYVVASFSKSLGVAIALGPVLLLPFLMVSGFVIQKASLPSFWLWLYHISPFVYGFSGLMRAAFLNVTFDTVKSTKSLSAAQAALMYTSGNDVLEYFSIQTTQQRWFVDILVLLAWTFLGRLLAMILFIISNQRRQ